MRIRARSREADTQGIPLMMNESERSQMNNSGMIFSCIMPLCYNILYERLFFMKHFLVVVDMQKDFVDGSLGSSEAQSIVSSAAEKIRNFDGKIFVTLDTHSADYLSTSEGKKLPVEHCIKGSDGWELDNDISSALSQKDYTAVEKPIFGSLILPELIRKEAGNDDFTVELMGLCTDICVISNALILKANFPDADISVDSKCCAGVTPALHEAALSTMKSCQINVM